MSEKYVQNVHSSSFYGKFDCITWKEKLSQKVKIFQNNILHLIPGHQQKENY